jgi:hypothetical protein
VDGADQRAELQWMRGVLVKSVGAAQMRFADRRGGVRAEEFVRLTAPLLSFAKTAEIEKTRLSIGPEILAFADAIRTRLNEDLLDAAFSAIGEEVALTLWFSSRFDGPMYWFEYDFQTDKVTPVVLIRVQESLPEELHIAVEGRTRRCVRCRSAFGGFARPAPVDWPAAPFGLKESNGTLPVYMQDHAVKRMCERWHAEDSAIGGLIHMLAAESMSKPEVIRNATGEFLIPIGRRARLGYFVASVADERIVIRTFLIPTMQGTPEADLLRKKLRLTRQDIEYLNLDDPWTLIFSDVKDHEEIVKVLEECGLGEFIRLARALQGSVPEMSVANQIRDYIGAPRLAAAARKQTLSKGRLTQKLLPLDFSLRGA